MLRKAFNSRVHWEPCRGNLQQNLEYTSKDKTDIVTLGVAHPMSKEDPGFGKKTEF